jgi:hypothetical protein
MPEVAAEGASRVAMQEGTMNWGSLFPANPIFVNLTMNMENKD